MNTIPSSADTLLRFLLPEAGVRGVIVRLEDTWQHIRGRSDYPPAAATLLGEACAAAALFTGHTKIDGRLSVQLRGQVGLRTLFAECTAAGTLRGIAQLIEGADAPADLRELGPEAVLAITIENPGLDPREPQRYQSLVALQADRLATAFEDYFRQSEQLPTRLLLATDAKAATGLLLQKLPDDEGDTDGWTRVNALFDTLGTSELLATAPATILHRLFHEEPVEFMAEKPLDFACSCSRQRVADMLFSLGQEEATAAVQGEAAQVRCEFCGQDYLFTADQIAELFARPPVDLQPPARLQ